MLADGVSYHDVLDFLKSELLQLSTSFEQGTSIDAYWRALETAKGKFLRFRIGKDTHITAKVEDRDSIEDREEHEIEITAFQSSALMEALVATLGEPTTLMWRYVDFEIATTVVSLIQSIDNPAFVFVEVEAPQRAEVDFWVNKLTESAQFDLKKVKNSFFDIYVNKHGVLL